MPFLDFIVPFLDFIVLDSVGIMRPQDYHSESRWIYFRVSDT